MADLLPPSITWRYYSPNAGSIWTAPNAISHICQSTGPGGKCNGRDWADNVDLNAANILKDIADCKLRCVNWVVPTVNSDHADINDGGGPTPVASIVTRSAPAARATETADIGTTQRSSSPGYREAGTTMSRQPS